MYNPYSFLFSSQEAFSKKTAALLCVCALSINVGTNATVGMNRRLFKALVNRGNSLNYNLLNYNKEWVNSCFETKAESHVITIARMSVTLLLPVLLIICFYVVAIIALKRSSSQLNEFSAIGSSTGITQRIKENQMVSRMFLWNTLCTICVTLPPIVYHLIVAHYLSNEYIWTHHSTIELCVQVIKRLPMLATCISPLFYVGVKNRYRKGMINVLKKMICIKNNDQ